MGFRDYGKAKRYKARRYVALGAGRERQGVGRSQECWVRRWVGRPGNWGSQARERTVQVPQRELRSGPRR